MRAAQLLVGVARRESYLDLPAADAFRTGEKLVERYPEQAFGVARLVRRERKRCVSQSGALPELTGGRGAAIVRRDEAQRPVQLLLSRDERRDESSVSARQRADESAIFIHKREIAPGSRQILRGFGPDSRDTSTREQEIRMALMYRSGRRAVFKREDCDRQSRALGADAQILDGRRLDPIDIVLDGFDLGQRWKVSKRAAGP